MTTQYLLSHLSDSRPEKGLAFMLGVSNKRLSQAFMNERGLSITDYVLQERMRLAQRLLLQTSLDISDIANQVGYAYGTQFADAFQEYVGVTVWTFRTSPPHGAITGLQSSTSWG